jgi:hypothetical protein
MLKHKIVLLTLFLLISNSSFAKEDWTFFSKSQNSVTLFDKSSIQNVEGTPYKSVKMEMFFYKPIESISYSKSLVWVDCKEYSIATKEIVSYTKFDQIKYQQPFSKDVKMNGIIKGSGKSFDLLLSQYVCKS